MFREISVAIITIVIIVIGIIAFNRLGYWERSVRIFKMNSEQSFDRRFPRERNGSDRDFNRERFEGSREGFERPDFENMPDSVRQRIIVERGFSSQTDSMQQSRMREFRGDRNNLRGSFERNGRDGRNFRRGESVQLRNVLWFLAVFAGFTAVSAFLDKGIKQFRKRKKITVQSENS